MSAEFEANDEFVKDLAGERLLEAKKVETLNEGFGLKMFSLFC
jgi:hypothetical protein